MNVAYLEFRQQREKELREGRIKGRIKTAKGKGMQRRQQGGGGGRGETDTGIPDKEV